MFTQQLILIHQEILKLKSFTKFENEAQEEETKSCIDYMQLNISTKVKEVCANKHTLLCFAYEVRKHDAVQQLKTGSPQDYYTKLFFKDVQIDPILMTIIESNYWEKDQMIITGFFELSFGDE